MAAKTVVFIALFLQVTRGIPLKMGLSIGGKDKSMETSDVSIGQGGGLKFGGNADIGRSLNIGGGASVGTGIGIHSENGVGAGIGGGIEVGSERGLQGNLEMGIGDGLKFGENEMNSGHRSLNTNGGAGIGGGIEVGRESGLQGNLGMGIGKFGLGGGLKFGGNVKNSGDRSLNINGDAGIEGQIRANSNVEGEGSEITGSEGNLNINGEVSNELINGGVGVGGSNYNGINTGTVANALKNSLNMASNLEAGTLQVPDIGASTEGKNNLRGSFGMGVNLGRFGSFSGNANANLGVVGSGIAGSKGSLDGNAEANFGGLEGSVGYNTNLERLGSLIGNANANLGVVGSGLTGLEGSLGSNSKANIGGLEGSVGYNTNLERLGSFEGNADAKFGISGSVKDISSPGGSEESYDGNGSVNFGVPGGSLGFDTNLERLGAFGGNINTNLGGSGSGGGFKFDLGLPASGSQILQLGKTPMNLLGNQIGATSKALQNELDIGSQGGSVQSPRVNIGLGLTPMALLGLHELNPKINAGALGNMEVDATSPGLSGSVDLSGRPLSKILRRAEGVLQTGVKAAGSGAKVGIDAATMATLGLIGGLGGRGTLSLPSFGLNLGYEPGFSFNLGSQHKQNAEMNSNLDINGPVRHGFMNLGRKFNSSVKLPSVSLQTESKSSVDTEKV